MAVFEDGLAGTTTTTGTGSYTVTGNVAGYREISQLPDGQARVFVIRTATEFEVGLYTKSGGSSPVLARTTVYMNRSGTTAAVNWGSGEKTIHSTVSAAILSALNDAGIRTAHLLMRGVRLALDVDDDTYLHSDADDNLVAVVNNLEALRLFGAAPLTARLRWIDNGAGVGPVLALDRESASPAASDVLGGLWFQGRDSAGTIENYVRVEGVIQDPTSGSEDAGLVITLRRAGADVNAFFFQSTGTQIYPSINSGSLGVVIGKSAQNVNVVGIELLTSGLGAFTTDGAACLALNRKNSDGQLISVQRDGVEVASVSVTSGTVTWGAFLGHHPSLPAEPDEIWPLGAVLSSAGEPFEPDGRAHLPTVQLSRERADRCVYGVFGGLDEQGRAIVNAIGAWRVLVTGPVRRGDLLWSSGKPGVAERQPDDLVRAATIGKVTMGDDRTDTRLVAVTLCCG